VLKPACLSLFKRIDNVFGSALHKMNAMHFNSKIGTGSQDTIFLRTQMVHWIRAITINAGAVHLHCFKNTAKIVSRPRHRLPHELTRYSIS